MAEWCPQGPHSIQHGPGGSTAVMMLVCRNCGEWAECWIGCEWCVTDMLQDLVPDHKLRPLHGMSYDPDAGNPLVEAAGYDPLFWRMEGRSKERQAQV